MTTTASGRHDRREVDVERLGYAATRPGPVSASADDEAIPRGVAGERERPARCSFAQEQFWFVDRLTPGSAAFSFSWPLRLRGPLDQSALRHAVEVVVARHEALRTRFALRDGRPAQLVDPPETFALEVVDLSSSPDAEAAAMRRVDEEARRPFDLEQGGLFRAHLIRIGEDDHVLHIVVHHIVFDEQSKIVLYRELGALYRQAGAGGGESTELPTQYADFAEWQRTRMSGDILTGEVEQRVEELRDLPAALELPTDFARPPVATLEGSRRRLPLPTGLTDALERLTTQEGAPFFAGVLAIFDALLHRYTGAEDIAVGIPVDRRTSPDLRDAVGVYLNTLVVRTDLSDEPTFRDLVRRSREALQRAAEHPDVPFERLVRELRPARDLSRHPIFQVLLAINPPDPQLELAGLEVTEIESAVTAAKVDLFLFLQELGDGGYEALWEYSTGLYREQTIERMHSHLVRLLDAALAAPDRPVASLELLDPADRHRLLVEWNGPDVHYPELPLHDLVEEQARRSPGAVAVTAGGDDALTYAELVARADVVAARLQSVGVNRGDLVAIALERSADLVVAALSVLKAGAAFVPVDPDLPRDRLSFMLDDSSAAALLTRSGLHADLPPFDGPVLDLDSVAEPGAPPRHVATGPEDAAYVIYTSGSTGRPKGVLNTHRGIVNRLLAMQDSYRLGPDDRLLLKTPSSFDVVVRELFWPLVTGARIVVAAPGGHRDPAYLADVIEREEVSVVHFVPSMLQAFLDRVPPGACRALRCVLSGGEELTPELARRFFSRFSCELHNFYGPTEAAVSVTAWRCEPGSPRRPVPIGRPIANSQVYVLDSRLQPVPEGVWGELFIGGAQVALGYHGRPELTAELFLPNPFGSGRLYRTGDLGRWTTDGVLEFGGRKDDQVKIRGVRIETGEVESVLCEHPDVDECAVTLVTSPAGGGELAGYVVLRPGRSLDDIRPDLVSLLRSRLPEAMVPATMTALDTLPLSPNGKLDRSALPAPERPTRDETFVEPATPTEIAVASIWSELLGVARVSRHDDFFALGGHSLLAARFLGRVYLDFDAEVPLRSFFQSPALESVAAAIDGTARTGQADSPLVRTGAGPHRCSFAQERFWLVEQMVGGGAAYNIPTPLRLRGALNVTALERALSEIVRRHEILRTHLALEDGEPRQVVTPPEPISLDVVDLSSDPDDRREARARALVNELTQTAFDIARGPLFATSLLRLSENDHVLGLVFNHVVFDGWSKVVLFDELAVLYNGYASGAEARLPEPEVQYGDFSDWQRSRLGGELLESELAHWRQTLRGMPDALALPTDRPRPSVGRMRGAWSRTTIAKPLVERLQALAQREGATLYMALLAAFDAMLHRYTGQDDIAVGIPVDSRDRPELADALGVFVDTVVLRVEMSGEAGFRELLATVRAQLLDALAHRQLPFERLVEELQPERQLGRHPLYQVMLTMVPTAPAPQFAGLDAEEIAAERTTAPIDLTVFVEERDHGLEVTWEYDTDLFDLESVERMQSHFLQLLRSAVAEPDAAVAGLPMLTEAEQRRLIAAWSRAGETYGVGCLHEIFEARVASTPDAPALTYEGTTLSYRELNERANRVAHRLRELGVGPETLVALCLRRSPEIVIAILAVLKAGGAYVPLDPDYPAERLEFVLMDAAPPVLVTQAELLPDIPAHGSAVLCLDRDTSLLDRCSTDDPEPCARPENLAYVIYTSGSTGRPKGVQVEHRQVARLFTATDRWFGFDTADTWLLFHSYAFDFSVWELWGALLHGGRLVIAPHWTTRSPDALAALLADEGVTVFNATPSLFVSVQAELLERAERLALRVVVFGGEALQPPALRPWFQHFGAGGPSLVNMYGITETTVHVTYRPISAADCDRHASPIGEPIPDLQLYVLDRSLTPVPTGVPGELFVGGEGVARGYLGRPELNAERFLPNPFGEGRLYRTGDRACHRPDGGLDFLGRVDEQVKIRGFRVELGEIEAALLSHAAIGEAAVVAVGEGAETRLAAYAVPAEHTAGAVRRLLKLRREGHALPAQLAELPRGTVAVVDAAQAELLHERIEGHHAYLRHGVVIPERAVVVDVGANIGLFLLQADRLAGGARILAVEPAPAAHAALSLNAEIYGLDAVVFEQPPASEAGGLSHLFRENGVERVDLLKVSVPEHAAELLAGIEPRDWESIAQVVVEARAGSDLDAVVEILERRGFALTVAQDDLLKEWGPRVVFGLRSSSMPASVREDPSWCSVDRLKGDLRAHLEARLPAYMVPSSIALVPELPLTPNGKLDRRSLPSPTWDQESETSFRAPHTDEEVRIAAIWSEILGVERVGADDNFFHLGGHSLLAARVSTQVRERFSIELSVRALFEHPTLAAFAEQVAASAGTSPDVADEAIEAVEDEPRSYPPSFPQQQLLFIDELATGIATYNGAFAVRVHGPLRLEHLREALDEVVRRHEALRTVFCWEQDGPTQVVLRAWKSPLRVVTLPAGPAERREEQLALEIRHEVGRPFDLAADLMLRATVFPLGPTEHVLLFVTHHIASDGWSVGVFCRDLAEIYGARIHGRAPHLPELRLHYRDFALWQRDSLGGRRREEALAYWRNQLAGAPTVLRLPTGRKRPANQTHHGASLAIDLPEELADGVLRICRENESTPYMVLLSLFGVLLYRHTGQDDILVGSPFANRGRSEFDDLVGFFANTLVMRVRLEGNPPFVELLGRVRQTVLAALEHQDVPFEHVVDAVRPRRDAGVMPLVQTNFRARSEPPPVLELEGTRTSPVPVDAGFAAFELALDLHLHSAGIAGELLYNTDLFDEERAIELAADYEGLLRQALAAPESRILGLRLPSDREPAPATRDTPIRRLRGAVAAEAPPEGLRERASESGGKRLSS